jgi:hypothetical protein
MMWRTWLVLAWVVGVALAGMGLAAGCGSSSAKAQATPDAGDATADGPLAEAELDAGPDINQDPDVYPANHHPIPQLDYKGGPILQHIRVVTVTFVGDPHRDSFRDFDHYIVTTPWWKETAEGYCIDGGACVGDGTAKAPEGGAWLPDGSTADGGDGYLDVELPYDFAGTAIQDSDIETWLQGHVAAGDFPAPDAETVYALYFPKTTVISQGQGSTPLCVDTDYGVILGYHYQISLTPPGASAPMTAQYAVLPYCDLGGGDDANYQFATTTASHELAEAATDPTPEVPAFVLTTNDAWATSGSIAGGECGDMCENVANNTYDESGYTVQRIWSNTAASLSMQPCQPWTPTYYGAALRTTAQNIPASQLGPPHISDGYVFVKRGESVDVIADVFSQAALPHDLLLYAGVPVYGAADPSTLDAPTGQVTVTISQQQVNNGDGVVVTFAAAKNAPATNANTVPGYLVIRSVLDQTDYNDWPVLVWVQ